MRVNGRAADIFGLLGKLSMFSRLFAFLFGDVPVEFRSAFSLQESVRRLRKVTKRNPLLGLIKEVAAGRVTEAGVRLQRVRPVLANPYKPIFVGRFEDTNGQVYLRGRFTMPLVSKIFASTWLSLVLSFLIVTIASGLGIDMIGMGRNVALLPLLSVILAEIILLMFGVALLRFSWRLSQSDIGYLTTVITQTLCSRSTSPPDPPQQL